MPRYDYRCPRCGHTEEITHAMTDMGIFACRVCTHPTEGPVYYLRRLIRPIAGVVFRGGGWASKS
jgi:putative FmdB family regulatory protein